MAQPAPKRRRLLPKEETTASACGVEPLTLVSRRTHDIRTSLQELYRDLDEYSDVVVCVRGEHGAEAEFPCVAALLAAASRPLGAMLFGQLRAATPKPLAVPEGRPRLTLRMTEPEHFKHLLRYIHGQELPLQIDEAFQMHQVADFYEVLGLRDECCRFLLDSLQPRNCCHLLARAYEVHCEPLAQRCLDLLTLDFVHVVEHDPDFPSLNPAALFALLGRDELVCAEEYEVFEAVAEWYCRQPSVEKYAALLELLPLVRWALVKEARRDDVLRHAAQLRQPVGGSSSRALAEDGPLPAPATNAERAPSASSGGPEAAAPGMPLVRGGTPLSVVAGDAAELDQQPAPPTLASGPAAAGGDGSLVVGLKTLSADDSGALSADDGDMEVVRLIRQMWVEPGAAGSSAADDAEREPVRERQYCWGELCARNPPGVTTTDGEHEYSLVSTKEYMIGRSRKSDIRIGHNAPMPYISSQHCRIYHTIQWPDGLGPGGAYVSSNDGEEQQPRLQAWLEDLSQNGTFINGALVGRNKQQALKEGDKIEMVFPSGRLPMQQSQNAFPIFTYVPHRAKPLHAEGPVKTEGASQADSESQAAQSGQESVEPHPPPAPPPVDLE